MKPSVRVSSSRDLAPAPSMEGSPPVRAYARNLARAQDVALSPTVVLASSLQHLLSFSLNGVDQDGPRGGSHLRKPCAPALAPASPDRSDTVQLTGTQYASSLDLLWLFTYNTLNDYKSLMFMLRHWLSSSAVVADFAKSLVLASPLRPAVATTAGHLVRSGRARAGDSYAILVAMLVRILTLNASYFLKNDGHFVILIKGNCIDSTLSAETVFAVEVGEVQSTSIQVCLAGDVGALRA
ncbi:Mediator of RNA polymerase II transcription subunit 36a [Zea mays]|uniref:Mediator of RNA polymerase II transcription subunit 36a n=2 Tax=Zea mays TaxID=4577 RepID=A0A3L6F606_MAIZE|nr:Mediator of RNA polymerase II transcription subunit 36a [Zea mays]